MAAYADMEFWTNELKTLKRKAGKAKQPMPTLEATLQFVDERFERFLQGLEWTCVTPPFRNVQILSAHEASLLADLDVVHSNLVIAWYAAKRDQLDRWLGRHQRTTSVQNVNKNDVTSHPVSQDSS